MTQKPTGRIAGIDYGTVRIGIALGDLELNIAGPYETYIRRNIDLDAKYFTELATAERLKRFVVGLPVHLDGHESQKSREARKFGAWLGKLTSIPIDYFDERFTSAQAEEILGEANLTKKRRQARIDQLAAQIMLTAYLESGAKSQENPQGLD